MQSDDGVTTHLVQHQQQAAQEGAGAGEGATRSPGYERTDPRYMEMDPEAYEVAESIAGIFNSLDQDHDNQVGGFLSSL